MGRKDVRRLLALAVLSWVLSAIHCTDAPCWFLPWLVFSNVLAWVHPCCSLELRFSMSAWERKALLYFGAQRPFFSLLCHWKHIFWQVGWLLNEQHEHGKENAGSGGWSAIVCLTWKRRFQLLWRWERMMAAEHLSWFKKLRRVRNSSL